MKIEHIVSWINERIECIIIVQVVFVTFLIIPEFKKMIDIEIKKQNTTLLKRMGCMIFGIDIN